MFGNTVCRGWAKAYWLSERSMSSHRGTWGGSEFFCSEASMVLDFVMQRTEWCAHGPWPTAEITAPSLKVCLSPDLLFPFSLSWETKPCAWAIFQRTHILSWLKKKKKITQAMKRCLSFENTPKSLECVFPICLLSEWLQFEFHHSKIHFLSMVLSRLTLSHSHACQVIARVSWEQQKVERKWEAWCFPISQSAFALGTTVGKRVS